MEILPTTSFQDLATKADLDSFGARLTAELRGEFATEFASVRAEAATNMRIMVGAQLASTLAVLGLISSKL